MATNLNVLKCNYEQAYEILQHCINLKMALLMHGAPGIGKSSLPSDFIKSINKKLKKKLSVAEYKKQKWRVMDIRLAQYPPEDMAGIPVPVEITVNGKKQWVTLRSLPDYLPKDGNGILFLDEINQANPAVLAAVFQLILDRKMTNSYELPEGWSIVAACNDFKHNSDVTEFNAPINDRFIHIELQADTKCWLNWAKKAGLNEKVVKFINANKDYLCEEQSMVDNIVFASPRSWEKVSKFEDLYDEGSITLALLTTVLSGIVGIDYVTHYLNYTRQFREEDDSYDFDVQPYKDSLLAPYSQEEYFEISISSDLNFARYKQVWDDLDLEDEEESRAVYHLTKFYYNRVSSNPENILKVWDTLFELEKGETSNASYIQENFERAWKIVYP